MSLNLFHFVSAQSFSDNFLNEIKKMLRFLFHVLSHLYYAHFIRIRQLDLHGYLNVVFKHLIYFVREFNLLDRRDTASLDDLVEMMGMFTPATHLDGVQALSGDSPRFSASPVKSKSTSTQNVISSTQQSLNLARDNGSTPAKVDAIQNRTAST